MQFCVAHPDAHSASSSEKAKLAPRQFCEKRLIVLCELQKINSKSERKLLYKIVFLKDILQQIQKHLVIWFTKMRMNKNLDTKNKKLVILS